MTDYATLHISDTSLLSPKLLKPIKGLRDYRGMNSDGIASGMILMLDQCEIKVTFMANTEIAHHLSGLEGYVESEGVNGDALAYLISRIYRVRAVLGCVIEPGFEKSGEVESFLVRLNRELRGLLFMHDSVIDWDGDVLAGPLKDT